MSKQPSAETELRSVRRELRECREQTTRMTAEARHYRDLAQSATREVAEWKARFDALLARDSKVTA